MFKALFLALALIAGVPTVSWKADVASLGGRQYELVLSGEVAPGYYTHPMDDEYSGTTLELASTVKPVGKAVETYSAAEYKGVKVIEGAYEIRQRFEAGSGVKEVSGAVGWMSCTGDVCGMPEDWEFSAALPPVPGERGAASPIWALILEAILWGLAMLLTPCVFPMVPMTVSFFIKGSDSKAEGRFKAFFYGLCIVLLYTVPICIIIGITRLVGGDAVTADIFNWLATHWLPNILFFVIFMIFAASFFGAFEITLPSSWVNKADSKSGRKGLGGIFFLALTLVLVSFSCTGPIVGTVLIKSTGGEFWAPMVTMLAFSVAFALPFTLLALFPALLKSLPKSGGWLNSVKVVLGFVEIALGLKFLSVADQTYHWHILDREVYLAIWIVCFALLGFYLLGKLRFKHDDELKYISVGRLTLAIAVFSFVVYMIPGMWGAPLKALSGYLPPIETQDFVLDLYAPVAVAEPAAREKGMVKLPHGLVGYDNIEDACSAAAEEGKLVLVDFTGHGCVNCREMEARVWSDPKVLEILRGKYVIASLYMDDKVRLPESEWVVTESGKVLKDVGRVNSHIAATRFGVNSQPNYAILSPEGELLAPVRGYDLSVSGYVDFLNSVL